MVALFGLREESDTNSRSSTCLLKALAFGKTSIIRCSTRTDTELSGALDRTQAVCGQPKSMADIRFKIRTLSESGFADPLGDRGLGIVVAPSGIPDDANRPVFGGRLSYYPTPYWTLVASVDETLGMSTFSSFSTPAGIPNLSTTAILQTTYGLSRQWSVGARFGYTRADYIGFDRLDNGWMAGASFNYEIWRNLALTLDYQYTTVQLECGVRPILRATSTLPALHTGTERDGLDVWRGTQMD